MNIHIIQKYKEAGDHSNDVCKSREVFLPKKLSALMPHHSLNSKYVSGFYYNKPPPPYSISFHDWNRARILISAS
jgi:hypothetical protein